MRIASAVPPDLSGIPARRPPDTPRSTRTLRGAILLGHVVALWLTARLGCPRLSPPARLVLIARLARRTLGILRVSVTRRGSRPYRHGACLVVANHVSWLDVYALNAVDGARSVAKSEVRTWPIAGAIARGFDTFFIVRGSFRDAKRVKDEVARALRAGQRVVVFPEGTTTDGADVGRFHTAFFQAAVDAGVPVQPVAIRYRTPAGAPDDAAAFVGDMTFVESVRRVLGRPRMVAELTFGPAVLPHGLRRRDLAETAHRFVRTVLAGGRELDGSAPVRRAA